ncbi:hypothetical protein RhiJN_28860 [Ceratobasidium sp. AG-Ba]|nr:hypothetical protein RhiJN_28860 [Ceratobasidium sp. AG-Ba]
MSCNAETPDVIALETRIAIYGYVFCSVLLGFLTWVGTRWRRQIEDETDRESRFPDSRAQPSQVWTISRLYSLATALGYFFYWDVVCYTFMGF